MLFISIMMPVIRRGKDEEMVKFSLIVTTRGRLICLERFLKSLQMQGVSSLEIILVDQTVGGVLDGLLGRFQADFIIQRIRTVSCGISAARNEGLKWARGEIVAFPDDDCFYPPCLLAQVYDWMAKNEVHVGVSCRVCDDQGVDSAGGVMSGSACDITVFNVWKTVVSCSFFMRREIAEVVGIFDETLGVGSKERCWAGEETDWILRVLSTGGRIAYRPELAVFHPQPDFKSPGGVQKAFFYGRGVGRVLRRHRYPFWFIVLSVGFQMGRALRELVCGDYRAAGFRMAMAIGRLYRG
jgi:glycosyltransferase involved in cell wall biosynthesis